MNNDIEKHTITLEQSKKFTEIFRMPLIKFWQFGFDIIAFDEWIKAGDQCLKTVVIEKYGSDAAELIIELCHGWLLESK